MKSGAFVLVASLMWGVAHGADVTAAFSKCASVDKDQARLACYDRIRDDVIKAGGQSTSTSPAYAEIALADLKVDARDLVGKRVSVVASIQTMGELSMLKSDPMDMAPIWANVEKLPRDDRRKLLNGCQVVLCTGQFFGAVQKGPMGMTFIADNVVWR